MSSRKTLVIGTFFAIDPHQRPIELYRVYDYICLETLENQRSDYHSSYCKCCVRVCLCLHICVVVCVLMLVIGEHSGSESIYFYICMYSECV